MVVHQNSSKKRPGGLAHLPHKEVLVDQCPEASNRCPVKILDQYYSRVLPDAIEEDTAFHPRLIPYTPTLTFCFAKQPIGKHLWNSMVKTACEGHRALAKPVICSLQATGATMIFQDCVPEKIIKEFTGQSSSDGVRKYERTPVEHQQAISSILASRGTQTL